MKQTIIYGITFLLLASMVSADHICTWNDTVTDTSNKYELIYCGTTPYVFQKQPDFGMFVIVLLPLLLGALLMYWATNMADEHTVLKLLVYLSPIPLFWISITFASIIVDEYYGFATLIKSMGDSVYITGLVFVVIVVYFMIYLLINRLKYLKDQREEKLNY